MKHAVYLPPFGTFGDVQLLIEIAIEAERSGWDGFYLWDHILYETDVPLVDAWLALAAVAGRTSHLRLGPLVTPLPRRRVWKVAREATTLDHLSDGRLTLGVGLGIDWWREFSGFDEAATDDIARAELVDEGIAILRGLWSGETFSHDGARSKVGAVTFLPKPVQQPGIPIWSAGLWPLREGPMRRAAGCEGIMPFDPTGPMQPDDLATLREQLGVGPDFDVCVHGPPEWSADYEQAGVTWFCLTLWPEIPLDEAIGMIKAGPPT